MIRERIIDEGWVYVGKCGMCPGTPEMYAPPLNKEYIIKIRSGRSEWFKLAKRGKPIAQGATIAQLEQALKLI